MTKDAAAHYKVAEAARLAGVSPSTLRLWETQGLVTPDRSVTGHRQYGDSHVSRLQRIAFLRTQRGLNPAAIREALEAELDTVGDNDLPQSSDAVEVPQIGRKLRRLRHDAGRTLEQVAGDVGIAASLLSTFERTSQGISMAVLHALAECFDTTVSSLSGEDVVENRAVVRAGEWRTWPRMTPGVTVQLLADGRRQMDCHRFVLEAGASSEGAYRHAGEEFVHVLSGRIEFVIDGDQFHDLLPGDSLYFESRLRHAWANRHNGETVLLWINTPPTF